MLIKLLLKLKHSLSYNYFYAENSTKHTNSDK